MEEQIIYGDRMLGRWTGEGDIIRGRWKNLKRKVGMKKGVTDEQLTWSLHSAFQSHLHIHPVSYISLSFAFASPCPLADPHAHAKINAPPASAG